MDKRKIAAGMINVLRSTESAKFRWFLMIALFGKFRYHIGVFSRGF